MPRTKSLSMVLTAVACLARFFSLAFSRWLPRAILAFLLLVAGLAVFHVRRELEQRRREEGEDGQLFTQSLQVATQKSTAAKFVRGEAQLSYRIKRRVLLRVGHHRASATHVGLVPE